MKVTYIMMEKSDLLRVQKSLVMLIIGTTIVDMLRRVNAKGT